MDNESKMNVLMHFWRWAKARAPHPWESTWPIEAIIQEYLEEEQ